MGATNTTIKFVENAHTYAPLIAKKLTPVGSVVLQRAFHPVGFALLFGIGMFAVAFTMSALVGDSGSSVVVAPDGTVFFPLDFFTLL
jgi:hypothetical protein